MLGVEVFRMGPVVEPDAEDVYRLQGRQQARDRFVHQAARLFDPATRRALLVRNVARGSIAAAMIASIWIWRLRLMRRLHEAAVADSD